MNAVAAREVALNLELPDGVELVEVFGYDTAIERDGYGGPTRTSVYLGDVHGGETRKVVARVRVSEEAKGELDIASVSLGYSDATTGTTETAQANVTATITRDSALARASVNKDAGGKVARARAAQILDKSARAWADGDRATNQALLDEGESLLQALANHYDAPELEEEADAFSEAKALFGGAAPASDDGIYQVKKAKEKARDLSLY